MVACVSPASRNYVETLSTLRYANRAKNIHNQPRVNEDPKDTMLRKFQEEIDRLRQLLESNQRIGNNYNNSSNNISNSSSNNNNNNSSSNNYNSSDNYNNTSNFESVENLNDTFDSKRDRIIQKYQDEMMSLKNLHENEKNEKETILKQMESIKQEYQQNLEKLNLEMHNKQQQKIVSKEEILKRYLLRL